MGRNKKTKENKKRNLALSIDASLYEQFEKLNIKNKSKFFNWLLEEHLGIFVKERSI
jgi:hypothetical protein